MPQNQTPEPDYVFASMSQTPEALRAVLEKDGFDQIDLQVQTDDLPAATPAVKEPVEESAPSGEPDTTPESQTGAVSDTVQGQEHKRPGKLERKIHKLTEEVGARDLELKAERDKRESLERELETLRGKPGVTPAIEEKPPVTKEETPAAPPTAAVRPKREDYWDADDPEQAYEDALLDWRDQESDRKRVVAAATQREESAKTEHQSRIESENQARADRWKAQRAEAIKSHADFDAVLQSGQPFSSAMLSGIHAMDKTAEIGYYLCSHPDVLDRLVKATQLPNNPTEAQVSKVMRLVYSTYDRIEAGLDDEPEPAAPVAAAPVPARARKHEPVVPVGSRGGKAAKDLEQLARSDDERDRADLRELSLEDYRRQRGMTRA